MQKAEGLEEQQATAKLTIHDNEFKDYKRTEIDRENEGVKLENKEHNESNAVAASELSLGGRTSVFTSATNRVV
jgi:hypothetical protein